MNQARRKVVEKIQSSFYNDLKNGEYLNRIKNYVGINCEDIKQGICAMIIIPEKFYDDIDFNKLGKKSFTEKFGTIYNPRPFPPNCGVKDHPTELSIFTHEHEPATAVTEITKQGEVKAFNLSILNYKQTQSIEYVPVMNKLKKTISLYLKSLVDIGIEPPFFVQTALLSINGYSLTKIYPSDDNRYTGEPSKCQQEDIFSETVYFQYLIEFQEEKIFEDKIKPIFDFI